MKSITKKKNAVKTAKENWKWTMEMQKIHYVQQFAKKIACNANFIANRIFKQNTINNKKGKQKNINKKKNKNFKMNL